jgi:folate-binding protein YgfZ
MSTEALSEAASSAYRAALESCALVELSSRDVLRVTGPDRVSFLHGMVTNDVEGLAVGASNYAALLTAKGAMVGDARILKRAEELLLDTGPGRGASVRDFLLKYLISEEAEVTDAPELAVLGLAGPRAEHFAAQVPRLGHFESFLGGLDLLVERAALPGLLAALEALPRLESAAQEVLRVERGVPLFGVDMTESTIPLEANLERALNYTKGCYIGQEVIARATYRGQMNKKLVGVELGEASPAPRAELLKEGKKVGWVTSVVRSPKLQQRIGLAYVHRDHLLPGTVLELASGDRATVHALPF